QPSLPPPALSSSGPRHRTTSGTPCHQSSRTAVQTTRGSPPNSETFQSCFLPNPGPSPERINLHPAAVANCNLLSGPPLLFLVGHGYERVRSIFKPRPLVPHPSQDFPAHSKFKSRFLPPIPQLPVRPALERGLVVRQCEPFLLEKRRGSLPL